MRARTLGSPPKAGCGAIAHSPLARGALEASSVLLVFVGFGLGWSALAPGASGGGGAYPPASEALETLVPHDPPEPPSLWLVDGFNVLQAGILGGRDREEWWTEPRRAELLERAGRFDDPAAEIWIVFDGPRPVAQDTDEGPSRLRRVFAPSADAWLLDRIASGSRASEVAVVTADRKLAARARNRGARVVSPRVFLARCPGHGDGGVV